MSAELFYKPTTPEQAAHMAVAELAEQLPDVAERQDAIGAQLSELSERHELTDMLQEPAKALILVGLSSKMATAYEQGDEQYAQQQEFTDTAIGLLTGEIDAHDDELDDGARFEAYMRYENAPLTAELTELINFGLLDDVKDRMGITLDNESPYEVHVLDIATSDSLHGVARSYSDTDGLDFREAQKLWELDEIHSDLITDYESGLLANCEELQSLFDEKEKMGAAWVLYHEGTPHLFMMNPTVEKLLHPEVTDNAGYYGDQEMREDLALLEHEYVHTQDPLHVDTNIAFGIGAEELRAEHFSGNKGGYLDIKYFFTDVRIVSGVDVLDGFDARAKGGSSEDMMRDIARSVGIESMLDVVMAAPEHYCNRGAMKTIYDGIGGYDGVIESMLIAKMGEGDGAAIEARIEKMAQTILDKGSFAESIINWRKRYGSNIVSDLVRDKMRHMQRAEYTADQSVSQ